MRVELLGPLRVLADDGTPLPLPTARRERAVLSLLALRAPSNVHAGELINGIWGDDPPRAAGKNVQTYISTLRKVLPAGTIETTPSGYRLHLTRQSIDIGCFEDAVLDGVRAVQAGEPTLAIRLLSEALETWRGEPLLELTDQPVGMAESARLLELRRAGEESLIDARLDEGDHAAIVGDLEAAIAAEPLREKRWSQLMLALYRCGRQADALRAFQRLTTTLGEELGIDPSREVRELEEAILQQDPRLEQGHSLDSSRRTDRGISKEIALPPARGKVCQPLVPLLQNDFVGRDAELGELDRRLSVGLTSPSAVLIMGEPGIGKTSLLANFAERAAAQNILCLYGRCDEDHIVPYQPFVEAMRSLLAFRERETVLTGELRYELARILPESQQFMAGESALVDPFDPATAQVRICRAVVEALNLLAAEGGLYLLLDDVQWADAGSLQMLRAVSTAVELSGELGLVAAIRNDDPSSVTQTEAAISDPLHHRGLVEIRLRGLEKEEIAKLFSPAAADVDSAEIHEAEVLQTLTGGNPLFATQLIRNGRESGSSQVGALIPDGGDLPFELSSVIGGRLHRLPDDVRRVLEVSAILGNSGSVAVLQETLRTIGLDEGMILAIDTAIARGFITINQATEFAFTHELVRQRLVAEVGLLQQKRLHLAVGESLEAVSDRDSMAQIAFHRRAAAPLGDAVDAARWTLRSATGSFYNGAFENARNELEDGLASARAFSTQSSLETCDLLLALAGVAMAMGDNDRNKEFCLKAAEVARSHESAEHLALAAIQMASAGVLGSGDRDVLTTCEEAMAAHDLLRPSVRAQLLGVAAYYQSTVDGATLEGEARTAEALRLAKSSESPESAAFVRFFRFWILVALGHVEEARALAEDLQYFGDLPNTVNDDGVMGVLRASRYWGRSYARRCRYAIAMIDGDREVIDTEVGALEATTGGGASLSQMTTAMRVAISLLDGDLAAADRGNEEVAPFVGTDQNMFSAYVAQLFQIRLEQDRLNEVEPLLRAALDTSEGWIAYRVALAFCCAQRGDFRETREILAELRGNGALDIPRTIIRMSLLGLISETLAELGDQEGAHEMYALLLPNSGQFVVAGWGVVCSGSVDRFLGILANTLGNPDLAVKHFDRAIEQEQDLQGSALLANTFYWKARTHLSRPGNEGQERDNGVTCLDRGVEIADRCGLVRLQRRLAELKSLQGLA